MRVRVPPVARRAASLALDRLAGAAGGLDTRTGARAEGVRFYCQRLAELTLGEDLDRDVFARTQAGRLHQLDRDLSAGVEALLQCGDVDGLGVRAEGLERHRLLHVRP